MGITCPRCHQDWIKKVYIGATQRSVFHCYECEATWFCENAIEFATFVDLSVYLSRLGIPTTSATYETFLDDQNWPSATTDPQLPSSNR